MRTQAQTTAIQTALRMLGNKHAWDWKGIVDSLYGLQSLAIELDADSKDLIDIRFTAIHLQFEEMK